MNQYTRYLTIAILLVQAPSYLLNLKMQAGPSLNASLDWTLFMVTSTIILAAGSMFILWLGERIRHTKRRCGRKILSRFLEGFF
jgi:preprotein translocase subunit SecY